MEIKATQLLAAFLFSMLSMPAAHALEEKDCTEVRLDQGNGPFAKIPVYDQRSLAEATDSEICYAVEASQLIDARRFYQEGKLPRRLTAPLSLAAMAANAEMKLLSLDRMEMPFAGPVKIFGMGNAMEAMRLAGKKPVCDQNWLNQFDGSFGLTEQEQKQLLGENSDLRLYPSKRNFLQAIHAEIKKYQAVPLPFLAGILGGKADPDLSEEFFQCRTRENVIPAKDIIAAVKAASAMAMPVSSIGLFLEKFCSAHSFQPEIPEPQMANRMKLFPRNKENLTEYRVDELEKIAHEKLNRVPAQPIGVQYCGSVQEKIGAYEIGDDAGGLLNYSCPAHASVIVGRRFNPKSKSCDFLVRDSFGPSCHNAAGTPKYSWECENGQFWIDSRQLMKSTFQLNWL
ncbi:MAG: hypothetical protein AB7K68_07030 [Bacteriovoracia bacterium]